MECDEVLAEVLVGSCPRTTDDVDRLARDHRVTAVLNLQTEEDFGDWQIDWPKLQQHYQTRGVEVQRVPVMDFDLDDLTDKLPACVTVLDELLRRGHKVYVHCNAGINRSPSTVVAYLHWVRNWTLDEALEHVLQRRVCDPYTDAIQNSAGLP